MGAGLHSGEPVGDPAGVPSDREQWSDDSKRSVAYTFEPRPYLDKAYHCWRCRAPSVFTAAEQKHTFEVRKASIDQNRVHCRACFAEWCRLDREVRECRRRWVAERVALRRDLEFLRLWLGKLEAMAGFGYRVDHANITMLQRLVAGEQKHAEPSTAADDGGK